MADNSPREWALAIGGGLALAAALVWALDDAPETLPEPAVTLTEAPLVPPQASRPAPQAPAPTLSAPNPAAAPQAGGYVLRGVMVRGGGGAAIIEVGEGRQRLVRAGGQVAPGVTLAEVEAGSVTLLAGGTRQTLLLDGSRPTPLPTVSGKGALLAATANDYRLGMKPVREDGRIIGYEITDTGRLPVFRLAGLQPGDVVVAIGGQGLESQEKLLELPAEIAGSNSVSIDYRRGGAAATATVKVAR